MNENDEYFISVRYLQDLADECDSLLIASKQLSTIIKEDVKPEQKSFYVNSIFNYLIVRICVFREELNILVKDKHLPIMHTTIRTIEKFEDLFEMSMFKKIRNWILAHPRQRRSNGLKHLSEDKKKDLAIPVKDEIVEEMVDLIGHIAFELDDDLEVSEDAKNYWNAIKDERDREIMKLLNK